ncbi:T9SS type B sorting domain-containing protein [Polaribacter sp.]|uniref:T9SS type B sorting domain-containing protein n=1 Tax=Polaribacter sp. TaxID=1920175 RepID=UPI003EF99D35
MKIYKFFLIFLLLYSNYLFSQKEANYWYFGDKAGLDFSTGAPVALTNGNINTEEGCATISDIDGNLLFYTDGVTVYNRNHNRMPNGNGLFGDSSSTQSAIIVPKPNTTNIYYIFTADELLPATFPIGNGINYSEVDMSLDSGLGDITGSKNINLIPHAEEKLAAIQHSNGVDYWVVAHEQLSNRFMAFLVSATGVSSTPIISAVGKNIENQQTNQGVIKFSPNGKKMVVTSREYGAELFDFNASNGQITNERLFFVSDSTFDAIYGAEFSANSGILYINEVENGVYQYNVNAGTLVDIINSKTILIDIFASVDLYGTMQMGPDGKIYIARREEKYLDVINNPEVLGVDCNYILKGLFLDGRNSELGLPPFIQSYFRIDDVTFTNTCFGDTTEFILNNTVDSVTWNFGELASGTHNTALGASVSHIFSAPGLYTITTTATLGTETSTTSTEVFIYKSPTATKTLDLLPCDANNDGFHNFNLTLQTNTILNGQLSSEFEVDYFASMLDYTSDTKIPDYANYQNTTAYQEQTIIARVRNKENSDCEAITQFKIQVFESPTPALSTTIPNLSFCDNTSVGNDTDGKRIFNLTDRETAILNGQSATSFFVSYFLDEDLTQPITNETNYENLNVTQRIYAKVENKANATCFAKTSFLIEVFELPVINSPVSLKQCDNSDINGFSAFNINEAKSKIVTNPDVYTITFFEEKSLAENNISPIPNPTNYTNEVVTTDTVWARVENNNTCFRVSEVNLIVSTTEIPNTFLKSFYECDDGTDSTDGIATFDFSSVTDDVKDLFPASQQLIIKYYRNEADALAEANEIIDISNYENIGYPNQQHIYIRVDSELDNDCLGLGHHITLNVETVPVANSVTIDPECDNDRDGLYSFDTSTIQSTIIGSQTNVAVRYFDANGIELSSPLPNPFSTTSQTITARITNTNSQDSDGQCFDETTLDFVVNSVPIANVVPPQEECDDDTDGIIGFDTSSIETTVLGGQTGLIVKYFDENNVALPSPLPNPFSTSTQTIRIRLENPIYDVCYEETTVDFIVREKPTFDLINEDIICMTNTPELDVEIENPNENNNTYIWTDENNTIISILPTATVKKGGVYTVVATSIYGCTSEEQEIIINESSISTININDIEVVDDSANNSITINTADLGKGDYQFRLLDFDANIIRDYQDDPFFDNLDGGVYTIEVNDRNGCGSIPFEVSLLSFPKFFTPNGDSRNDVWQINGLSKNFYQSGTIKVFNRYGNLMYQFTIDDIGWDGTYNGKILQSNDYWFYVNLLDKKNVSRTRSGHFSLLRK